MATSTINDKIDNALELLALAPGVRNRGRPAYGIKSALVLAKMRIEHLELRLGETETMRDRIAMQLLPGIQDRASQMPGSMDSDDCIRSAYHQADKVLAVRLQGSAGAPGETTSPENSKFQVGDPVRLIKSPAYAGVVIGIEKAEQPTRGLSPHYTGVEFFGKGGPYMICLTADLESVGE